MKKHLIKIFVFCIGLFVFTAFLSQNPLVSAQVQTDPDIELLSQMTEDECFDFIIQNGIEIPVELDEPVGLKALIKKTIEVVESEPSYDFVYNFDKTQKLVEDIRELVNNYYGVTIDDNISYLSGISSYQLQYNYVYGNGEWRTSGGEWNDKWLGYNCYAYSINRSDKPQYYNPYSYYIQYQPGDFAGTGSYYSGIPISSLASIIKADLEAIGLTNVTISDSIPTSLNSNQKLICVRTGAVDYHFMRFDPVTDAWYHKPGNTAVLKYKYVPSNSMNWITEGSFRGEEFYDGFAYNSSIKYIVYDIDTLVLNCHTTETIVNKTIPSGKDTIYEINIECAKSYKIVSSASYAIDMYLYDDDMNLLNVAPVMSNNNRTATITSYLNSGTYYLRLKFTSSSNSGAITTRYQATWPSTYQVLYNSNNNILSHLHKSSNGNLQNVLHHINTRGAGFYEFTLTATKADGTVVTYPADAMIIKDHMNEEIEYKYDVLGYSQLAKSDQGINNMYVYLPRNGYFYIHIDMPDADYSSMTLNITPIDYQTIDMLNRMTSTFTEEIFDEAEVGDYAKRITINQTGKFTIDFSTIDNLNGNVTVILFKREYNSTSGSYYKIDKYAGYMNNSNKEKSVTLILDPGIYYIGYFNNSSGANITATLTREMSYNPNMLNALITDPSSAWLCGSEVRFNGGSYNGAEITEGFTRVLWFSTIYSNIPSLSRLHYDWYSSNPNVATVSQHGTVLAKPVSQDTQVTIYAVYKYDPSIVYVKTFTIKNDTSEEIIEIVCNMTYSYSEENGTYQLELDDTNCPYPWIQDYTWSVFVPCQENDILVSIGMWGQITASGPGYALLTGHYITNPRVYVYINLTITP